MKTYMIRSALLSIAVHVVIILAMIGQFPWRM